MTRGGKRENSEFILLHSTKYGENSLVLHALGRDWGRRSLFLRSVSAASSLSGVLSSAGSNGGRRGGSRAAVAGLVNPLNILEGEVVANPASADSMATVRGLGAACPLTSLRGSLAKSCISMFIAEVLFRTLKEGANEPGLYDWCRKQILLLDALEGNFSNFHLLFLLEFAVALGFRPSAPDLAPFVPEELRPLAGKLMNLPFGEALLLPMNGAARSSLAASFLAYLESHLEYPLNIRSAVVLKELF